MTPIDELDADGLSEVIESEPRGVLIDFWSPWCAPCRTLRPHLARLADEHAARWRFVAVNVDEQKPAADAWSVSALPTLVLYRGGREAHRFTGATVPSSIAGKLDELDGPPTEGVGGGRTNITQ